MTLPGALFGQLFMCLWENAHTLTTRFVAMILFSFPLLAACVLDKEASVRAQLGQWVVLGETRYFNSEKECTAGVFQTKAGNVKSRINKAHSIKRAMYFISQGKPVAFRVNGMTPGDLHKALDKANRSVGLAFLTSGLGARGCLTPALRDAFAIALQGTDVIVMYDPMNNALALLQRSEKRVFYARGDVG